VHFLDLDEWLFNLAAQVDFVYSSFKELKAAKKLPKIIKLRQIKYLNNTVEQDHPWLKRLIKSGMGFISFNTARRTIEGYEIVKSSGGSFPRRALHEHDEKAESLREAVSSVNFSKRKGKFWEFLKEPSKRGFSSSTKPEEWLHNLNSCHRGFLSSQSSCDTTIKPI
jgi:DDE domain